MFKLEKIGYVVNNVESHADCLELRNRVSELVIFDKYIDGLKDIEKCAFLQVLFNFHLCKDEYELIDHSYNGHPTGIFASRSNERPNNIGLTTVKLIERKANRIKVLGLDALNGSPILDIKPYNPILDEKECAPEISISKSSKTLNLN